MSYIVSISDQSTGKWFIANRFSEWFVTEVHKKDTENIPLDEMLISTYINGISLDSEFIVDGNKTMRIVNAMIAVADDVITDCINSQDNIEHFTNLKSMLIRFKNSRIPVN